MKRKRICDMTADECLVSSVVNEFGRLLNVAKRKAEAAQAAEDAVFKALDDMCIDLGSPTGAENATTIEEAITCYLSYNEYTREGILREVTALYETKQNEECRNDD